MVDFLKRIMEAIQKKMGDSCRISLKVTGKVDGSWEIGIQIQEESGVQVILLLSFYREYEEGTPLEQLAEKIIRKYENAKEAA